MKRITNVLLAVLIIIGALVTSTYVLISFLSLAIYTWIVVLIAVFTTFVYETYNINVK